MKNKRIYLAIAASVLVFASCKKKEEEPTTPTAPTPQEVPVKDLFNAYTEAQTQNFIVDANTAQTITGSKGTELVFSGNNFSDANGNPLVGNVDVELIEIYNKSSMILNNKVTIGETGSGLAPIISGGEFYISFKQNDAFVTVTNPVQVNTVATQDVNWSMQLFDGDVDEDGDIIWLPNTDSLNILTDTIQNSYYNFNFGDSVNWINCDYFMGTGDVQTSVGVDVPGFCDDANTAVYVVFADNNAVVSLYDFNAGVFSTGSYYTLPVGLNCKFVVITNDEGTMKYSITDGPIESSHLEVITTMETVASLDELQAILDTNL